MSSGLFDSIPLDTQMIIGDDDNDKQQRQQQQKQQETKANNNNNKTIYTICFALYSWQITRTL